MPKRYSLDWDPPKWHPCHWRVKRHLASFLYVSGITSTGGSSSYGGGRPPIYQLPRWRDVLPYRLRWDLKRQGLFKYGYKDRMRPYFLWKRNWWWQCHKRQGWKLWTHHTPYEPAALGICGRCLPCPDCGSPDMWCPCYE